MNVLMSKIEESDVAVQYKITMSVPAGSIFDERGRGRTQFKEIYAYVTLNKANENFVLDINKSDHFFIAENPRELTAVKAKLIGINRVHGVYKDTIVIATC